MKIGHWTTRPHALFLAIQRVLKGLHEFYKKGVNILPRHCLCILTYDGRLERARLHSIFDGGVSTIFRLELIAPSACAIYFLDSGERRGGGRMSIEKIESMAQT